MRGRNWWRQEGGHMGGGSHITPPPQLTPPLLFWIPTLILPLFTSFPIPLFLPRASLFLILNKEEFKWGGCQGEWGAHSLSVLLNWRFQLRAASSLSNYFWPRHCLTVSDLMGCVSWLTLKEKVNFLFDSSNTKF